MNGLKKFKKLRTQKKISLILVVIMLLYSIIYSILLIGVNQSCVDVMSSLKLPDMLIADFNQENPEFQMSYSLQSGLFDMNEFTISTTIDISFEDFSNNSYNLEKVFFKKENFGYVPINMFYESIFIGNKKNFNLTALTLFWNNMNLNKTVEFIFDFTISGRYCLNLVPFEIEIRDLNTTL